MMSGITIDGDRLVVDREPNVLDELALAFSSHLDAVGIDHAFVAGYVAILAGRARATEDIDVLLEPTDTETAGQLATRLRESGFWGPAMPLDALADALTAGDRIWIARDGEMAPRIDATPVRDTYDRASIREAIVAEVGGETLPIGPLELQIAYKCHLAADRDLDDAAHLLEQFGGSLNTTALETWVERLDVQETYAKLVDN